MFDCHNAEELYTILKKDISKRSMRRLTSNAYKLLTPNIKGKGGNVFKYMNMNINTPELYNLKNMTILLTIIVLKKLCILVF